MEINSIGKIVELSNGNLVSTGGPNYADAARNRTYVGVQEMGVFSQTNKNGVTYHINYPKKGESFITREINGHVQRLNPNMDAVTKGRVHELKEMYKTFNSSLKTTDKQTAAFIKDQLAGIVAKIKTLRLENVKWGKF